MRALVFGTNGQVSRSFRQLFPQAQYVSRSECDFERPEQIRPLLDRLQPEVIINPAAYTEVDKAEVEFERAALVNCSAPSEISEWCRRHDRSLIHFSTDYVYSGLGDRFWCEDDPVAPVNKYGLSKLQGEDAIRSSGCHHIILRTSWVYSPFGKNFVRTMLRLGLQREELKVVDDQTGSPTYALDIADVTLQLLNHVKFRENSGIYNLTNQGVTSWFGFAVAIFEEFRQQGLDLKVQHIRSISSSDFPTIASRPKNSRMSGNRLERDFGVTLREWKRALSDCARSLMVSAKSELVDGQI